jgi:hypothetical protein
MKSFILSIILIVSAIAVSYGQQNLLDRYIDVKDALVKGDATTAATQAAELYKALKETTYSDKLSADALAISKSSNIEEQRKQFKSLSDNFYTLSKTVKLSEAPYYRLYCPMKKSYWLSKEAAVQNPYYGRQMLTCGNVSDTL